MSTTKYFRERERDYSVLAAFTKKEMGLCIESIHAHTPYEECVWAPGKDNPEYFRESDEACFAKCVLRKRGTKPVRMEMSLFELDAMVMDYLFQAFYDGRKRARVIATIDKDVFPENVIRIDYIKSPSDVDITFFPDPYKQGLVRVNLSGFAAYCRQRADEFRAENHGEE